MGVTNAPGGPVVLVGRTGVIVVVVALRVSGGPASGCGVLAGANPGICGRLGFSGELVYPTMGLGLEPLFWMRGDLNGLGLEL
jgi:hypothetical protein